MEVFVIGIIYYYVLFDQELIKRWIWLLLQDNLCLNIGII